MKIISVVGLSFLSSAIFASESAKVINAPIGIGIGSTGLTLQLSAASKGWGSFGSAMMVKGADPALETIPFVMNDNTKKPSFKGNFTVTDLPDGKVRAVIDAKSVKDQEIQVIYIGCSLPFSKFKGGAYAFDGNRKMLPAPGSKAFISGKKGKRFEVFDKDGKLAMAIEFAETLYLGLQDNTTWNGNHYSFRASYPIAKFKAGDKMGFDFTVTSADGLKTKRMLPVTLTAGEDWLPFEIKPFIQPGSALDFSTFRGTGAKAGEYGRVIAVGDHFEFEKKPGEIQRFYGANLCFSANYVDKEIADRFAAHFARVGYNAIRFHHHDNQLTVGSDKLEFDEKCAKQFDGMVAACVENGIYMTTDLYVSRKIPYKALGIDQPGICEMGEFKELVQAHEGAYQNYIKFARAFLEHVNAYTGRRNADEPALAWLSLVNEGNLGNNGMKYMRKHPCFGEKYAKWLAAKRAAVPEFAKGAKGVLPNDLGHRKEPETIAYELFLQQLELDFAARVTKVIREEIKSKQLLTNMNCWHYPATLQLARSKGYDYLDDHFYVDHPQFVDKPWQLPSRCPNENPLANEHDGVLALAFRRVLDRPFTITEYNYAGPGRYRGVGGIACGTLAALQGWSGLWRFAWGHRDYTVITPEKCPLTYFDMSGDPLGLASERASICLFLRRDIDELKNVYAAVLPERELTSAKNPIVNADSNWRWAGWYAKIGNVIADAAPAGMKTACVYPAPFKHTRAEVKSALGIGAADGAKCGGGHLEVDGEKGRFLIATARTCGGFGESGAFAAGELKWNIGEVPSTVWVSSLDMQPIASSRRLLLTHLTDVQNSGIRYADDELKVLQAWGKLPHLMRRGKAEISLKLNGNGYTVYVLDTDGTRRREVNSSFANGELKFTADIAAEKDKASYIYEIVAM